jgi:hypothetical protein
MTTNIMHTAAGPIVTAITPDGALLAYAVAKSSASAETLRNDLDKLAARNEPPVAVSVVVKDGIITSVRSNGPVTFVAIDLDTAPGSQVAATFSDRIARDAELSIHESLPYGLPT